MSAPIQRLSVALVLAALCAAASPAVADDELAPAANTKRLERVSPAAAVGVMAAAILPASDRLAGRGSTPFETPSEGAFTRLSGLEIAHTDRIVLSDRVLFDRNRARVKSVGRARLREVAAQWHARAHWATIHVEGHTDRTGPEAYNTRLSTLRAERVVAALIELGVPPDALSSEGFGSSRRLDVATTPEAHGRNRRVELVIGWSREPRR